MEPWKATKALYRPREIADLFSCHIDTVYTLVLIGELVAHNRTPGRKGMRITGVSAESYIKRHLIPAECAGERKGK